MPLTDSDLPLLYRAADESSQNAQRNFLVALRVRLVAVAGAAAFGLLTITVEGSSPDWAGVAALVLFIMSMAVGIYLLKEAPERTWYEARAAAESAKTLSWRYAVGGEPFGLSAGVPAEVTDDLLLAQLDAVVNTVKHHAVDSESITGEQITAAMRRLRSAPLEERKRTYGEDRVMTQQHWYSTKAKLNRTRAQQWALATSAIEVAGIAAAVAKSLGMISVDLLGFAGALVAATAAWQQAKQHGALATAYGITALELADVRTRITHQHTEADWSIFASDAEEAFSREHTLWRASRGIRSIDMPTTGRS